MAKRIYIGKLPNNITDQQIYNIFSKIGKVVSVKIIKSIGFQKNMSYGYIQMNTDEDTKKVINTFNNSVLEGSRIRVVEAHFLDQENPPQYHHWKRRRF